MPRKPSKKVQKKDAVVAFKVEQELADLLDELPNKSAFIRQAITAQLGMACPLCAGTGILPRGLHDHYAPLLGGLQSRKCDGCGVKLPLPRDTHHLSAGDKNRLEQFLRGGPLYCDDCYAKAPPCTDCGWHVDKERIADHLRQVHSRLTHSH